MKSLSIDTHPHDPAKDEELYELLKEADGNTTPATSTGDDDGEITVGTNPDEYPDPEDSEKKDGTIDASWGQKPGITNDAHYHANEVRAQFRQSREDMLSKLFDGHDANAALEQKTMGQYLSHASSGQFETSSPQLSSKAKGMPKVSSAQSETLMEMTRRITGRH